MDDKFLISPLSINNTKNIRPFEISKEDIIYALDAIQTPLSLYDPVYTDSGDTLYVMDQISDKKNKEKRYKKAF